MELRDSRAKPLHIAFSSEIRRIPPCSLDYAAGVFARLNGIKRLARGNHDVGLGERLPWDGPVVDVARVEIQDPGMAVPQQAWISHYAHRVWPGMHRGHLHLFGHSHGNLQGTSASTDVGVDCFDFRPATLDEIRVRLAGNAARE